MAAGRLPHLTALKDRGGYSPLTPTVPAQTPVWLDFADGSVPFWNIFAKPGVVALASNYIFPPKPSLRLVSNVFQ